MHYPQTMLVFRDLKLFPALNKLLREHFGARKRRGEQICWLIKEQTKAKHTGRVSIRYMRFACQLQDWDNHCASFKDVGDALVDCKVITDDSPKVVVNFSPTQEKVNTRAEEKIVVIIEDIF